MAEDNKEVLGYECRFAVHIPTKDRNVPDVHMVKEQVHYKDGTIKPRLRFVRDFKRPVWITRPNKRVHKQKKEWEHTDNLLCKEVTQSDLRNEVAKLLGRSWSSRESLRDLCASPYVYGADVSSSTFIKKAYKDRFPELSSLFTVGYFDIETDMLHGTEEVIMASFVFRDYACITVTKNFLKGFPLPEEAFNKAIKKYIQPYIEKHNLKVELLICEDSVDAVKKCFAKIHEKQPDFLAIWNMDFDIPRVIKNLEKYGVDPADVLCDPSIPREMRLCRYKQGQTKKTTASGKVQPINPAMQWHTLFCTSSFYVIDAMCTYKHARLGVQEEPSYSLDAILDKELGIRKLSFIEADNYSGGEKHIFMQSKFPIEYMVYNLFDSLSMQELNDKTQDLTSTLPVFSACSDFENFKSQPKRIIDALFFFCQDKNYILGTVGPREKEEVVPDVEEGEDDEDGDGDDPDTKEESLETLDLKGWIVTLQAHMSELGLCVIMEDPTVRTGIRCFVYDSDAVSAYPTATSVANVSKETTFREVLRIEGIEEIVFRMQNMNLITSSMNSLEYSVAMFNLPKPDSLVQDFLAWDAAN